MATRAGELVVKRIVPTCLLRQAQRASGTKRSRPPVGPLPLAVLVASHELFPKLHTRGTDLPLEPVHLRTKLREASRVEIPVLKINNCAQTGQQLTKTTQAQCCSCVHELSSVECCCCSCACSCLFLRRPITNSPTFQPFCRNSHAIGRFQPSAVLERRAASCAIVCVADIRCLCVSWDTAEQARVPVLCGEGAVTWCLVGAVMGSRVLAVHSHVDFPSVALGSRSHRASSEHVPQIEHCEPPECMGCFSTVLCCKWLCAGTLRFPHFHHSLIMKNLCFGAHPDTCG